MVSLISLMLDIPIIRSVGVDGLSEDRRSRREQKYM